MTLVDKSKAPEVKSLPAVRPRSKRITGPTTRLIAQREADHPLIAQMLVRGDSYVTIAKRLKEEHGRTYPCSKDTVHRDVQIIYERWRLLAAESIDKQKGLQLMRIQALEERCYAALDRLEEGASMESSTVTGTKAGEKEAATPVTIKKTSRKGNADTTGAWLATLRHCLSERSKILGLYAPIKVDGSGPMTFGGTTLALQVNITNTSGEMLQTYDFPIEAPDQPDGDVSTEPA